MLKRTLILSLVIIMIISMFCSCGKEEQPEQTVSQTAPITAMVTFPEGLTVMKYGELLEQNGVCTAEAFYSAVNDVDYSAEYGFLPQYTELADRIYRLEGYLYPDTYEFYLNTNAENVVRKMLNNFSSKISEVYNNSTGNNGLSFDEAVVLASIVERESHVATERPKIAQVFLNRLNAKGDLYYLTKLQSDATRYYPYTYPDVPKGFESEYNTYEVRGLPKGPICNPSLSSISAVLSPDSSVKAYFFYTDINNKHYYAKTYEQHKKNIKYCKDNGLAQ